MSFATAIENGATYKSWLLLEIESGSDRLYLSDSGLSDPTYGDYSGSIKKMGSISRSLNPQGGNFGMPSIQVTINNHENIISDNYATFNKFVDLNAAVYILVEDNLGNRYREKVYEGLTYPIDINAHQAVIQIRAKIFERVGLIQRVVNRNLFQSARESDLGRGMGIPLGNNNPQTSLDRGLYYCPVVDVGLRLVATAQGTTQELLTSIPNPGRIYRLREGDWTEITSGNWQSYGTNNDREGESYLYVQIDASDWEDDDDWYVIPSPFDTPDSGGSTNTDNIIEMIKAAAIYYSNLIGADFHSSWATAITELESRTYDETEFGYFAPLVKGKIQAQEEDGGWNLMASVLRSTGYYLYLKASGELAVTEFQPWETGTSILDLAEINGDFRVDPKLNFATRGQVINEASYNYGLYHRDNTTAGGNRSIVAKNETSQTQEGIKPKQLNLAGVQGGNAADDIADREIRIISNAYNTVVLSIPGLWGLNAEIGDYITATHKSVLGEWDEQLLLVSKVTLDPMIKATLLECWVVDENAATFSVADTTDYKVDFNGTDESLYQNTVPFGVDDFTLRYVFEMPSLPPLALTEYLLCSTYTIDRIAGDPGAPGEDISLTIRGNGTVFFRVWDGVSSSNRNCRSSTSLVAGVKYDIICHYDNSTFDVKMFINGVDVTSNVSGSIVERNPARSDVGNDVTDYIEIGFSGGGYTTNFPSNYPSVGADHLNYEWSYEDEYNGNGFIKPDFLWYYEDKSRKDVLSDFTLIDHNVDDSNFIIE